MGKKSRSAKRIDWLHADTPLDQASGETIDVRLRAVSERGDALRKGKGDEVENVHQLRVGTRRAGAAIQIFQDVLEEDRAAKTRKRLKRLRKAAGAARDCDVHRMRFAQIDDRIDEQSAERLAPALRFLDRTLAEQRDEAMAGLQKTLDRIDPTRLAKDARKLRRSIDAGPGGSLESTCRRTTPGLVRSVHMAAERDLRDYDNLHQLRIELKRLRYAMEIFAPCLDDEQERSILSTLKEIQDRLGAINDTQNIIARLRAVLDGLVAGDVRVAPEDDEDAIRAGLAELRDQSERDLESAHAEFLQWWPGFRDGGFFDRLHALEERREEDEASPLPELSEGALRPEPATLWTPASEPRRRDDSAAEEHRPRNGQSERPRRLAAIDMGTNSIRLVVAEAAREGGYRILDDEKEMTRLGQGLTASAAMSDEAMERSAQAVARMKSIAEGYDVERVRLIGTAVVREASNAPALADLLRRRTGLEMEIISADEEARLAFLSAAHHFDLRDISAGVVDIGGGSTEVILSSGGLVEQVYTIPIGAVRMTEQFGGPKDSGGSRYDEMRRFIMRTLDRTIGEAPFHPQTLIGTGGTLTTLGDMSLLARMGGGPSLGPGPSVRGHEMMRSEVKHLLDNLRKTPVSERSRTPGLPEDRADIIVAGLAIGERLMKKLGVNRLRVHDRGIRDGLLLTMLDENEGVRRTPRRREATEPMASVRAFAEKCGYEAAHCEHVARMALRIFDRLRDHFSDWAGAWARPESRRLLEAAAFLRDVGYHIDYSKHHHHSYHLIMHADFRGFTPREIELIANIARYHRRSTPKKKHQNFGKLPKSDRELVRALSAILRFADGLDRTHTQRIQAMDLRIEEDDARFIVSAPEQPSADIWGAMQKADLFRKVFKLHPVVEWRPLEERASPPSSSEASIGAAPSRPEAPVPAPS